MHLTTELTPADGATRVSWRGEKLEGERLAAWERMGPYLLANLDAAVASLATHLSSAAIAI